MNRSIIVKKESIYYRSYFGIGDNIYQRPFVIETARTYKTVFLDTPVPELYLDCGDNIRFVKPAMNLRTQSKIVEGMPEQTWVSVPKNVQQIRPCYHRSRGRYKTIKNDLSVMEAYAQYVPNDTIARDFKLPVLDEWVTAAKVRLGSVPKNKKLCIIKPPTRRAEWDCPARNSKIIYFNNIIQEFRKEFYFVSVADIKKDAEFIDGVLCETDKQFHKGEFKLAELLGLCKLSDMIVTAVGFMLPMAAAVGAKQLCIFGGYMRPECVIDKNMGLENLEWITPEPMCNCFNHMHQCHKDIDESKLIEKFISLINKEKT